MSGMLEQQFAELKLTGSLPSPTGVGLAILQLTQSDDYTVTDIAHTLQADPTLTGRILKLANSSTVAGARAVTNVQDACVRLGARNVRNLALGFTLVAGHRSGACTSFDYETYWSRSLALAVAAQNFAARGSNVAPGDAFTCGLLAHIGRLALASIHPIAYASVLAEHRDGDMDRLSKLEHEEFGLDHRVLAQAMFADWKLPESFGHAASSFDRGDAAEASGGVAAQALSLILRAAYATVPALALVDSGNHRELAHAFSELERARRILGLSAEEMERLLNAVGQEYADWGKLMNISVSRGLSYELLAKRVSAAQAIAASPSATAARSLKNSPPTPTGLRVLVASNDAVQQKLIVFHLAKAGHTPMTASDGKQAMLLALQNTPHILVSDWSLAEMDGLELTRSLRRSDDGKRMHIILLTSRDEEQRALEAFEAGVDEYLNKPFNPQILLARIRAGQRVVQLYEQIDQDREERGQQLAQLAVMTRKLQAAALTDPLTELHNRRFAMQYLEQELTRVRGATGSVSVIMVDIDRFKSINDTYGHDIGDLVLKEVATLLRRTVRTTDKMCRLGGEEFLAILPRTEHAEAARIAERVRAAAEANVIKKGELERAVTLSCGVATFDPANPSVDALLKSADVRVYAAKNAGRNRVVSSDDELGRRAAG